MCPRTGPQRSAGRAPWEFFCGPLLPFQPLLGVSESRISPQLHTCAQACTHMHTWKHKHTRVHMHPAMTMHTCVHECPQTHLETQACTTFTHRVTHTCAHTCTGTHGDPSRRPVWKRGPSPAGLWPTSAPSTTKRGQGLFWTHTGAGLRDWAQGPPTDSGKSLMCAAESLYQAKVPDLSHPALETHVAAAGAGLTPQRPRPHQQHPSASHPRPRRLQPGRSFVLTPMQPKRSPKLRFH